VRAEVAAELRSMAGEAGAKTSPTQAWGLHPDQSFLGKPIDPDVVARVRGSLDKYQGPRSIQEQERIIGSKVSEAKKFAGALSAEYWAWTKKVKEDGGSCFKLPDDPKKGMPTQEEHIRTKVAEGLREMRKDTLEYKAWLQSLREKKEREKQEELEKKQLADIAFNQAADARFEERMQKAAEFRNEFKQRGKKYWQTELPQMKSKAALRPSSCPAPVSSGVESAASMAQRRKQESIRIQKTMSAEYSEWLRDVSVARFVLPLRPSDREERARQAELANQRVKDAAKEQAAYFKKLKEVEKFHHERIMGVVKERLEADKKYELEHEAVAKSQAAQREEQKQARREHEKKCRKELKDMATRVKEKKLFLEVAYHHNMDKGEASQKKA